MCVRRRRCRHAKIIPLRNKYANEMNQLELSVTITQPNHQQNGDDGGDYQSVHQCFHFIFFFTVFCFVWVVYYTHKRIIQTTTIKFIYLKVPETMALFIYVT